MRKIKSLAIFMITLILTLPIYTSLAFADVTYVAGSDGAKGFRRSSDDVTTIKLTSNTNDVRYVREPNNKLPCTTIGANSSYECTFNEPPRTISSSSKTYTFYQYPQGSGFINDVPIKIDGTSPIATLGSPTISGKNLVFNFNVTDTGACSGISKVEFFMDGNLKSTYPFNASVGACSLINKQFSFSDISDGVHTFNIEATDFVQNSGASYPFDYKVDTTSPAFEFVRMEKCSGTICFPLGAISKQKVDGVVLVFKTRDNMSKENLVSSIEWDLSELAGSNQAYAEAYKHSYLNCALKNFEYTCRTKSLSLMLTTPNPTIGLKAKDAYGNQNEDFQSFPLSIEFDSTLPKISLLNTFFCNPDTSVCYLNKDRNILSATIQETGSGFNHSNFYFSSKEIFGDETDHRTSECRQEGSYWICEKAILTSLPLSEGVSYKLYAGGPNSKDDAGNSIMNKTSVSLIYDSIAPNVSEPKFTRGDGKPYISTNDEMKITLKVFENMSGLKATADLSYYVPGASWTDGQCMPNDNKGEGNYICEWYTDPVYGMHRNPQNIVFNISDYAGNKVTIKRLGPEILVGSASNVSYWSGNVSSIDPSIVDRVSYKYLPGKMTVWADVTLTSATPLRHLYTDLYQKTCEGVDATSETYLKSAKIYPLLPSTDEKTSSNIIISIELNKDEIPSTLTMLRYKCVLLVSSSSGSTLFESEQVPVEITIPVADIGNDLPQDYSTRIADLKQELKDDSFIDSINSFMETGNKLCKTLTTIVKVYQVVKTILNPVGAGLKWYQITKAVGIGMQKAASTMTSLDTELLGGTLQWTCGMFECTLLDKLVSKYGGSNNAGYKLIKVYIASLTSGGSTSAIKATTQGGVKITTLGSDAAKNSLEDASSTYEASTKSIFVAALSLCIPGIISNLEKARQIDCNYIYCAENTINQGLEPYACEDIRAQAYCAFVYGQVFHSIPFSGLLAKMEEFLNLFASNPITAAYMAVGLSCAAFDPTEDGLKTICQTTSDINNALNFLTGTIAVVKSWTSAGSTTDMCARVLI